MTWYSFLKKSVTANATKIYCHCECNENISSLRTSLRVWQSPRVSVIPQEIASFLAMTVTDEIASFLAMTVTDEIASFLAMTVTDEIASFLAMTDFFVFLQTKKCY